MDKKHSIENQIQHIDRRVAHAHEYVARGINVEGISWFHLDDWRGKSGHPLWMEGVMIPAMSKWRAKKEKALETIDSKERDKRVKQRRREEDWPG